MSSRMWSKGHPVILLMGMGIGAATVESSMVVSLKAKNRTNINSVHLLSRVQLSATPCTAACQASLSFSISWSLLKLMSIKSAKRYQVGRSLNVDESSVFLGEARKLKVYVKAPNL